MFKRFFDLAILCLWLCIAVVVTINYKTKNTFSEREIEKIFVIDKNSFDVILEDQSKITVSLPVNATDEAKQKIIELLKESSNPKVILYNKRKDGRWLADLKFLFKEKEISLKDWLSSNDLVEE
jgi:hypothetical protein